ncbi:YHS domain-containing (seleno)protein [Sulfitobacter aestuariivivens]|nr:YHS domain-containing (seleno)protein [Sulfitobacter aestuariivivens]
MTAGFPVLAEELISTDSSNLALSGYDPVAYFTQSKPVEGSPDINLEWQGANWQFASPEHRAMFADNPDKYAPRYGGFCAGGMSLGRKTVVDPEAWMIVDGKLFMGGSHGAIAYMEKDTDEKIAKADKNWETLGVTN